MVDIIVNSAYNEVAGSALPKIGIMILNQNGERWLSPLYHSIKKQNYAALNVYLVDNASTDGSVRITGTQHPDVTILRLSKNAGYCMAYNLAMPIAFERVLR